MNSSHSGYHLEFGERTVTKDSFGLTEDRHRRLQEQARLQDLHQDPEVRAPAVTEYRVTPNGFSFSMERIVPDELLFCSDHRDSCLARLFGYLRRSFAGAVVETVGAGTLIEKVDKVDASIWRSLRYRKDAEQLLDVFDPALDLLRRLFSEGARLPLGRMHGDLTFCNVICSNEDVYLIDFLDDFISSPVLDVAKLRQDSRHGWVNLFFEFPLEIRQAVDDQVVEEFYRFRSVVEWADPFTMLALLRAVPYATEDRVIEFLHKEVSRAYADLDRSRS